MIFKPQPFRFFLAIALILLEQLLVLDWRMVSPYYLIRKHEG